MGANKQLFSQERIKAEMYLEDYQRLEQYQQDTIDIKAIEPEEYDYSGDEQWLALYKKGNIEFRKLKEIEYDYPYSDSEAWTKQKKVSNKCYKDLKKREFEIRNK